MGAVTFSQSEAAVHCVFASTLTNIDTVIDKVKHFLRANNIAGNHFELVYVLREALNNAVIHGNKKDSTLDVEFNLKLEESGISMEIANQGPGFNWRKQLLKKREETTSPSGRGLQSMIDFGFALRFDESGNTLYLTKKIR